MEFKLPPVRKLILPDPGHIIFDIDMSGADAQVVAWEAEDVDLKAAFRRGVKIHIHNFEAFHGRKFQPEDKYKTAPGHIYPPYDEMKRAVHATNYLASPRTIAVTLQWKVSEAEGFQRRWFNLHPGIRQWHQRCEKEIQLTRAVKNKLGYRITYFQRPQEVLAQALAWIPQSTVGLIAAKAAVRIHKYIPWAQVLMQVHDSVVFQIPFSRYTVRSMQAIHDLVLIPIPYSDPLIIPWGIAASPLSWGHCQKIEWDNLATPWSKAA